MIMDIFTICRKKFLSTVTHWIKFRIIKQNAMFATNYNY